MRNKGFSLIESLISLSFFLLVALAGLEFFGVSRRIYASLEKKEESSRAAACAMDKLKSDLGAAGEGLVRPIRLGALRGVNGRADGFVMLSREAELSLAEDAAAGQTLIVAGSVEGLRAGQDVCLFDSRHAEVHAIVSLQGNGLVLSSPLSHSYIKEEADICALRQISYYLDGRTGIIRRKVNASPAQPMLEGASAFECSFDEAGNLAAVRIRLKDDEEKTYEITFFPKNTGLAAV